MLFFFVVIATAFINKRPIHKLTYLKLTVPQGWPEPTSYVFANNPLTEEGFQLGRQLFYDGILSKDGNFSCAGCHQQFAAFANFDHDFSHGFDNSFTTRNAPGLFNIAWQNELHWDGSINHIEVQALTPITAQNEMAETLPYILKKLNTDTSYIRLFKNAFSDGKINSQHLLKALAQFTGSIQSYNTKYDKVKRGVATFTISEALGYKTFSANCNSCHKEPLFTDNSFRNNGIGNNVKLPDFGRMGITGLSSDSLKFKVPSLRNCTVTFPYMHDGRIYSLGKVIEHYRIGIDTTQPTLDQLLRKRLVISDQQKIDLLSFLMTLKDDIMIKDPRYSQPVNSRILPSHQ